MDINTLKAIFYWAGLSFFLALELRFSYRQDSVSKLRRWITNIPLSVINGAIYYLVFFSVLSGIMMQAESHQLGLLNYLAMLAWLKMLFGILALDFFLYVWHLLNHVVPLC